MNAPEPAIEVTRDEVASAADRLLGCRRLLVIVGAGGSADSGVPTFRDEGGLWQTHRPEDLAHPDAFRAHPQVVWRWYNERRAGIRVALPHSGQRALALLQRHFRAAEVLVVTTNEDDLLERAGVEPVVHLHGSVFETACAAACGWRAVDRDGAFSVQPCPACGALTRPGSVWFGEALPPEPLEQIAGFQPDGCLVVGSSCLVAPVSQIPIDLALAGVPVIEVNPQSTPLSQHAFSLRGAAKDVLPRLVDLLTSTTMRDQRTRTES
jgi:NAD-dependent deacetylase